MEVDETQTPASKFSRVANGKIDSSKIGTGAGGAGSSSLIAVEGGCAVDGSRLRSWQHSSRIIRVSRASGGKDRHSKVWTAKGPRDRRVRLSVATAIQFYDLQDRLGVDQPSKAVEWLIKAASDSIAELPSLDGAFPETPRQQSDENRPELGGNNVEQGFDSSAELELDGDRGFAAQTQQQHGSNLSKSSACSSNSETSKGSGGLSLSRNEIRVKARERARERTAKERETESVVHQQNQNDVNHQMTQSSSSFTQLLTAGIGNMENAGVSSSSMENYFNATGLMGSSGSSTARGGVHHSSSGFTGQIIQLGNSGIPQGMMAVSPFSIDGENHHHPHHQNQNHHHELQHFPFVADHHLVVPGASNADHYNLNFTISPSSTGALAASFNNRGTLQSNSSQSLLPQLQRFSSSPLDHATTLPFFLGAAIENQHHQNQHQSHQQGASLFPHGLQQYYGGNNGGRQSLCPNTTKFSRESCTLSQHGRIINPIIRPPIISIKMCMPKHILPSAMRLMNTHTPASAAIFTRLC